MKESDNYKTDLWILEMFEDWFDPCPLNPNYEIDGLKLGWQDKTFVNPPYSKPRPFIQKAIEENKKGKRIALLLKMDTSTKWFTDLQEAGAHFLWVNGRLKHNTGKGCAFPSMIAILPKGEK